MSARYKDMCGCECCISDKILHSILLSWRDRYLKKLKDKSKIFKSEGLVKKNNTYMKHIKIQCCHMGVIFMPKHLMWQRLQCAHILSLIIHFHTGRVYYGVVMNVHTSIFLTKKQIKHKETNVTRNYILSFIWRCYGLKRYILEYWGTIIFCLLSYYILSKDKGL